MSKILVTGADGFTGRHLSEILMTSGHEVHGVVRKTEGKCFDSGLIIHQCDLLDKDGLKNVIADVQPEKIVHLAAISFVAHAHTDMIYATNLIGSRNLLEAIDRASCSVEAILLASSANIYGNQQFSPIGEEIVPQPMNDYSVSKIAMEYMSGLYQGRMPIFVVRPFNYTGVGQERNFLIPKIVDHLRRQAPRIELGNIDIERDWSDVRMVVQAYARLLETPNAIGKTINVCSGKATNLRELISLACSLAGHHMELEVNPAFVRSNEVRSLRGDNALLRSLIGSIPDYPIEETIQWMLGADEPER